jgi:hypothetical protein
MKKFYHWTHPEKTASILETGLKPGIEVGMKRQYNGVYTDNRFVYLAKNLDYPYPARFYERFDILTVEMPRNHPVERDMDAKVLFQGTNYKNPFQALGIVMLISKLGIKPRDGKFDLSAPEKIEELLLSATEENWDNAIGFYRTPLAIPNKDGYRIEICRKCPRNRLNE